MSRVKLKLALYSCSGFCTLTFTFSLRFATAMGQVVSIKFTWTQFLSFDSNKSWGLLPSARNFVCGSFEQLIVSNKVSQPRSREVATWSTFAGGLLPNFIFLEFCPNFWLIFLEVPTYQAAEAETMLGDPSGEHREHTPFCPFTPHRFHLVPSTSWVHTRKICQDSGCEWPSRDL